MIYTFRLISAEDTKEEEEIEEYETDEDANMEEKDESTLSSSESQRKEKEELSDSFFGDTQEEKVTVSN